MTTETAYKAATTKKTMPTPSWEEVSPPEASLMTNPARAGPAIRERLKVALCKAVAFTMWDFPTISGVADARAGMLKAKTVPLKSPK